MPMRCLFERLKDDGIYLLGMAKKNYQQKYYKNFLKKLFTWLKKMAL